MRHRETAVDLARKFQGHSGSAPTERGMVQPVAWLARSMGLSRQGVQRIASELEKEGLVAFEPNPHHRRASLVVLTETGRETYAIADRRQTEWVNAISRDFDLEEIQGALSVITAMRTKIEQDSNTE